MECFICMEESDAPLYKVCNCDTVIHSHCLERLVNSTISHATNCAVCKKSYNITHLVERQCNLITPLSIVNCRFVLLSSCIIAVSSGVIIYINYQKYYFINARQILMYYLLFALFGSLISIAITFLLLLLFQHIRTTGHICCYTISSHVIQREINLSNILPIQPSPLLPGYADEPGSSSSSSSSESSLTI